MPNIPAINSRRISQQDFGDLSYEVMRPVFDIHSEFGRFFDKAIYKRELAARMKDVRLEVPVDVVHGTFSKTYFADVLVRECGLFEFKAPMAFIPGIVARRFIISTCSILVTAKLSMCVPSKSNMSL